MTESCLFTTNLAFSLCKSCGDLPHRLFFWWFLRAELWHLIEDSVMYHAFVPYFRIVDQSVSWNGMSYDAERIPV